MKEEAFTRYIENNINNLLPSLDIIKIKQGLRYKNQIIDLTIQTKGGETFFIETKVSVEPTRFYETFGRLRSYINREGYLIIATTKMSERVKYLCQKSNVGYFDLQGNVYIKYGNILIDQVQNRKIPIEYRPKKRRIKRPFNESSFRVFIYLLINRKKYVTQEEISVKLGISRGYVNRILKTFEEGIKFYGEIILFKVENEDLMSVNIPNNYIVGEITTNNPLLESSLHTKSKKPIKYYRLTNPGKILDILSKIYNFNENKVLGYYSFERNTNQLIQEIATLGNKNDLSYALTQHAGASQVAPFVRFDDIYFYMNPEDFEKWKKKLNLRETELGGNIYLVIPKYKWFLTNIQKISEIKIVNNIILYLDLINYPKRGKEQAEYLRKQQLGF